MPLSEDCIATPRIKPCDMDLAAFAFDLELDDEQTDCDTYNAALCTLHASWTASEAQEAYNRKCWTCGSVEDYEQVCSARTSLPSPRPSGTLLEPRAPTFGHDGVSPACVDMSLFWSTGSNSADTRVKHEALACLPPLRLQGTR